MEIVEAIRMRRSIRAFKPDPVPRKVLEELLDTSRWSPSGSNMQTWEFSVLGGKVLEEVKCGITKELSIGWDAKLHKQTNANPDIPEPTWPEVYVRRRLAVMPNVDRHPSQDQGQKQFDFRLHGGRFYDAPNAIIVYADRVICPKAIVNIGLMTQTIALAALNYGLGTCIMSMPVYWPDVLRDMLGIPKSKLIALSIAVGYPDMEAPINCIERVRESSNIYTRWHGV